MICTRLGLAINKPASGARGGLSTYLKKNRAFDLGSVGSTGVADLSGNGRDAELFTGIYASTNGTTDKLINVDLSAAPRVAYAKVWVNGVGYTSGNALVMDLGKEDSSNYSYLSDDDPPNVNFWGEATLTRIDAGTGSQNGLLLGYSRYGDIIEGYYPGDWSDLRLYDADDNLIARYMLNDSDVSSLDTLATFESSGNGHHGTHIGGAGGSGEAGCLQTAGLDFNDNTGIGIADFEDGLTTLDPARNRPVLLVDFIDPSGTHIVARGGTAATESDNYDHVTNDDGIPDPPTGSRSLKVTTTTGNRGMGVTEPVNNNKYLLEFTFYTPLGTGVLQIKQTGLWLVSPTVIEGSLSTKGAWTKVTIEYSRGVSNSGSFWIDQEPGDNVYYSYLKLTRSPDMLCPADPTDPTNDVLGNPIALPRPSAYTINLMASGAYLKIDETITGLKSLFLQLYYGGEDGTILDLYDGPLKVVGGNVSADFVFPPTIYVDGVAGTTLTVGWHSIEVTTTSTFDTLAVETDATYRSQMSKIIGYTVEHTADQALQMHNALKSKMGT